MIFHELKLELTTAPFLTSPTTRKEFELFCEASHEGLGCILMQERKAITKIAWAQASNAWLKINSHCLCIENLATLPN